jgi:hypothetical protein
MKVAIDEKIVKALSLGCTHADTTCKDKDFHENESSFIRKSKIRLIVFALAKYVMSCFAKHCKVQSNKN